MIWRIDIRFEETINLKTWGSGPYLRHVKCAEGFLIQTMNTSEF